MIRLENVPRFTCNWTMSTKLCIISCRVKIPKVYTSFEKVLSELFLRGTRPTEYASREPFVCYSDGGDGFIVPKMYGVTFI